MEGIYDLYDLYDIFLICRNYERFRISYVHMREERNSEDLPFLLLPVGVTAVQWHSASAELCNALCVASIVKVRNIKTFPLTLAVFIP